MTIDKSGRWWRGTEPSDLDAYLVAYTADGYPVSRVIHAVCACGERAFAVEVDDEDGCARRTCQACGAAHPMLDSADYLDEAELGEAACPCGGATFEAAVGFATREDGSIRWVYLALRCVPDGVLGVYADWKIDYPPSDHLYDQV